MTKSFHLSLMIGPVVPVPAPKSVIDALESVEIKTSAGEASGFQLKFRLSQGVPLHTLFLLAAGSAIPVVRVILVATIDGTPDVLMDGMMTHHQITTGSNPGETMLTISGKDLTAVMDLIELDGIPYPAMPPEARVLLILAKYAPFGIIPMVIPSFLPDVSVPVQQIPYHSGTDLAYIQYLAGEAGHVFYISPGPAPGVNIAYWGPQIKLGVPQPALTMHMGAATNVESMSFTFDSESKTTPVLFVHNELTKIPIPIPLPDFTPLSPPLGAVPTISRKIKVVQGTAKMSPARAALRAMAEAARSADAVKGSGTLDVLRYGRVLKARQLVGVRGAGTVFDGLYYVDSVTQNIKRGEYKESFSLVRGGLVSTVPRVPV